jgi:hypothetical protein
LPQRAIREQIVMAVGVLVQLQRTAAGPRVIHSITELQGMEGDTVLLQDIFHRVDTAEGMGRLVPTGLRPKILDELAENGIEVPPQLFRNDGGNANHWIELFLIGVKSNRDAVGARVEVSAGDLVLSAQRKGGMSYQSAQDPRLHFGLGSHGRADSIVIRWPSGTVTRLVNVPADRIITVREGEGIVERAFPLVPPAR